MLNRFFISIFLCTAFTALTPNLVQGQNCDVHYEMVTKLFHPDPGSYTVWDTVYGEGQKDEIFTSIVNHEGGVLAVGEMRRLPGVGPSLMLVHFDRRGRKVWEKYHAINGLRKVVKILPRDNAGYVVLANRHKNSSSLWLGFFDKHGTLKSHKIIQDKGSDLFANDMISRGDAKGWAIAVTTERPVGKGKNKTIHRNGLIYLLDKNGNEEIRRVYTLGTNDEILGLSESKIDGKKAGYIATGYFENTSGQKIARLLYLNEDISLIWQKEFRRGLSAKLAKSSAYAGRYLLVFGDVEAADSRSVGSWLMLLELQSGKIMWQRYYYADKGNHDYTAQGLYARKDGLITVMMMARSKTKSVGEEMKKSLEDKTVFGDKIIPEYMDYAHLLTLSPRGITLSGDSYYFGQGVSISQLIEGDNGTRVMAGHVFVPPTDIFKKNVNKNKHKSPLREKRDISLPDALLSDKTKKGLALLKHDIDAHAKNESTEEENKESAKSVRHNNILDRNGWVVIGDMPDTYKDPCAQ